MDIENLLAKGAVGITDDGVPILDAELTRKAMELSAKYQVPVSFHEEDPAYIENNGINHERHRSTSASVVLTGRRRFPW